MMAMKRLFLSKGLFFISSVIFLAGCVAGSAHFKRTVSASNSFENHQLMPAYNYYYSGHSAKPVAVIGLKEDYKVASDAWVAVKLDETKLRTWIDRMMMQPGAEYNMEPNGAYILDDSGEPIGIWYSVYELPQLTVVSDKVVAISRPNTIFPHSNRNPGGDDREDVWPAH